MNRKEITKEIEKYINGKIGDIDILTFGTSEDSKEQYLINVAIRLVNEFTAFNDGVASRADYLNALRIFLLSYHTAIEEPRFQNDELNRFGIYRKANTNIIFASYDIPDYIQHSEFVRCVFDDNSAVVDKINNDYYLYTNSYIRKLTGGKYNRFKSIEQKLAVYGALRTPKGYTTLVSMPTGGGKSLITQSIAFTEPGLTIVIVPTVSLAIDQERAAKKSLRGVNIDDIFCYYSGVKNAQDIFDGILNRKARLLFISPEALIKSERFRDVLDKVNADRYIKNIVIDEAHIVIAWGDLFRVDYQCLEPWKDKLMKSNAEIRTFLLSATFEDNTVRLLESMFSRGGRWIEIRCDALRREPRYITLKGKSYSDKKKKVLQLIDKLPHPMIIYVNTPSEANKWQKILMENQYSNIKVFTGETKSDEREDIIRAWNANECETIIATSAFGVGVDKPDVRTVLHVYVPQSPDAYYQELGRGGRDGLPCLSVMCIVDDDIIKAHGKIGKVLSPEKFWGRWWSMFTNDNMWLDGAIAIDTMTKPNYNNEGHLEEGNRTDGNWNINVLLLLSRYNEIKIEALDLTAEGHYIITIRVLNDVITKESKEAKDLFMKIREDESKRALEAFDKITVSINLASKRCWSDMFADTYPLVSEYCAGCNSHTSVNCEELGRFPLLEPISSPLKDTSLELQKFFGMTREALIIRGIKNDIKYSAGKYCPDVIVTNTELGDLCNIAVRENHEIFSFKEFKELLNKDNWFYLSGIILVIYSNDKKQMEEELKIIRKYIKEHKGYVIHYAYEDYYFAAIGKKFSEIVDGAVIK